MIRIDIKKHHLLALAIPFAVLAFTFVPGSTAELGTADCPPEHTLEADALDYAMGAETIEEPVVMSKDGVPMVMPGIFIDSVTDVAAKFPDRARPSGRYCVSDFTYDELKSLRITASFNPLSHGPALTDRVPDATGAYRIPTLDEAFFQIQELNEETGGDVRVIVSLKAPAFFEHEGLDILAATIDIMTEYGYNQKDSKAILAVHNDMEAIRSEKLGWKGSLTASYQTSVPNQTAVYAQLVTEKKI